MTGVLIHLDMDSDDPSPAEYAQRLAAAAARAGETADKYGTGDLVAAAERLIAARLGTFTKYETFDAVLYFIAAYIKPA